MVCFGYIIGNTVRKGDNRDNNNNIGMPSTGKRTVHKIDLIE